jgi:hypothetical protein
VCEKFRNAHNARLFASGTRARSRLIGARQENALQNNKLWADKPWVYVYALIAHIPVGEAVRRTHMSAFSVYARRSNAPVSGKRYPLRCPIEMPDGTTGCLPDASQGRKSDDGIMNIKLRAFAFASIASLALLASCDRSTQTTTPPAAATPSPSPAAAAPAPPASPTPTP